MREGDSRETGWMIGWGEDGIYDARLAGKVDA